MNPEKNNASGSAEGPSERIPVEEGYLGNDKFTNPYAKELKKQPGRTHEGKSQQA